MGAPASESQQGAWACSKYGEGCCTSQQACTGDVKKNAWHTSWHLSRHWSYLLGLPQGTHTLATSSLEEWAVACPQENASLPLARTIPGWTLWVEGQSAHQALRMLRLEVQRRGARLRLAQPLHLRLYLPAHTHAKPGSATPPALLPFLTSICTHPPGFAQPLHLRLYLPAETRQMSLRWHA